MTFSGYLEDYIGVRFTIVLGCVIMTVGVLLTSISIQVKARVKKTSRNKKLSFVTN